MCPQSPPANLSTAQPDTALTLPDATGVAAKERHGFKLLPKTMFWKHACNVKCPKCRKVFRICPEARCWVSHPKRIRCLECSHVANERWLKGWNNELVPCPNCWGLSTCSGMSLQGDSTVHC